MKLTPSLRRILTALEQHGDMEADEIAERACVAPSTLSGGGYLTKLLTLELIRVSKWRRQDFSGPPVPTYSVTPGESKPKPKPYTAAQKSRRWKQRVGYRSAEYMARKRVDQLLRITA